MPNCSLGDASWKAWPAQWRPTLVMACTVCCLGAAAVAGATGQVDDPAAPWSLFDTQGQNHSLSDYENKVLLLFFAAYG